MVGLPVPRLSGLLYARQHRLGRIGGRITLHDEDAAGRGLLARQAAHHLAWLWTPGIEGGAVPADACGSLNRAAAPLGQQVEVFLLGKCDRVHPIVLIPDMYQIDFRTLEAIRRKCDASISFVIQARLTLMLESRNLTGWRYEAAMKPTSTRQPSGTPTGAGEDDRL